MAIGVEGGAAIVGIAGVLFFRWYLKKQNSKIQQGDEKTIKDAGSAEYRYVL